MKRFAALIIILILCFPAPALAADFEANLYWDGSNIIVKYDNFEHGIINPGVEIWVTNNDKTYYVKEFDKSINKFITELKPQNNETINPPREYDKWTVEFKAKDQIITKSINCWTDIHPETGEAGSEIVQKTKKGPIPIFMQGSWEVIMFWYYVLASLSGACIFLVMIRSGYQQMLSSTSNPGLKASFSQSIERCIIGIVIIIAAPYLVNFLIEINDSLVYLFANVLDYISIGLDNTDKGIDLDLPPEVDSDPWLARIVAWPFQALINIINTFFGLHPLGDVIFNGHLNSTVLTNDKLFMGNIQTSNLFTQALLNLAMLGFTVYFNAVYTIRRWVVIAVMAVTPLIIWIWVLTSQRNVIELWLSELIQTIFMQTWHALTFGIFFSILCFSGGALSVSALMDTTTSTSQLLISVGKWVAGVGGVICAGVIIGQAFKLAIAQNEKSVEEIKTRIQNALIGLVILGLSLTIASFLTADPVNILNPIVEESEPIKITFWQLFFVLFTIIPVSKMLSMIFMSILARFGTVDEHGEAGKASGMLAGLAALGGGAAAAASGKASLPNTASSPGVPGSAGAESIAGTSVGAGAGGTAGVSGTSGAGTAGNPGLYDEVPGIYEGDSPGTVTHDDFPGAYEDPITQKPNQPDKGLIKARETDFMHTLNQSQEGASQIAKGGAKLGFGAGMFAGAPQGMAALFGGATKAIAAPIRTTYDLGMGVRQNQSLPEGTSFTGRTTTAGAAAQTLTAIALSPFGSQGKASITAGRLADCMFGGVDMYAK